jgi:hypothetical protein
VMATVRSPLAEPDTSGVDPSSVPTGAFMVRDAYRGGLGAKKGPKHLAAPIWATETAVTGSPAPADFSPLVGGCFAVPPPCE